MNETERFAEDVRQDIAADQVNLWSELYALDAVSDAERDAIDEYIFTASNNVRLGFQHRVRQARKSIITVFAACQAAPPASLWPRILEQISAGNTFPEASAPGVVPAGTNAAEAGGGGDELARRRHRRPTRPATTRRWIIGAVAAAAVAIGSVTVAQNLNEPPLREQVVEASDVSSTTVQIAAGGTAQIKRSESLDAAVVTLRNVPAPQPGKVYQMWQLPDDGSAPESVDTMSGEDVAQTKTTVVKGIHPYSALAITVEPEGGSKTPTMPTVAQIPPEA